MAVYTHVSDAALAAFLSDYALGEAVTFKGIAEGVENSNYFLETTQGKYILTLFEKRVRAEDLPFFVDLKQHLAAKHFPCPLPIAGRDGDTLRPLAGRTALIISFLPGLSPRLPSRAQCHALGAGLARLHQAAADYDGQRENSLGPLSWPRLWQGRDRQAEALRPGLSRDIIADLDRLKTLAASMQALPQGIIHADLFPDNAFFMDDKLTGVIDFYFACTGALAYDLAICLNAWAFGQDGTFNFPKAQSLILGYTSIRPLLAQEKALFPALCHGSAMRFFLTRLIDWSDTPPDAWVQPKDPLDYANRLAFHRRCESLSDYGL